MNEQNKLPDKQPHRKVARYSETQFTAYLGPLPPPDALAKYNNVLPGAADRIITMAEKQADHRQGIENKVISSDTRNSTTGMILGFLIVVFALYSGIDLIKSGYSVIGITAFFGTLASLGGVFVYATHQRQKERKEQRESQKSPQSSN